MKRTSIYFFIFALAVAVVSPAHAQDAATQQQLDKLSGQIQDLTDAQLQQSKRLDAIEKEISDMGDKVNSQPAANNYASTDDLKKLADAVKEVDRKRQEDNQKILQTLEQLSKVSGGSSPKHHAAAATPVDTTTSGGDTSTPAASGPQKGYYYTVAAGDYISTIAKAYRAQGVKVSSDDILKANPGLDPAKLYVGKKIFIPDPNAK